MYKYRVISIFLLVFGTLGLIGCASSYTSASPNKKTIKLKEYSIEEYSKMSFDEFLKTLSKLYYESGINPGYDPKEKDILQENAEKYKVSNRLEEYCLSKGGIMTPLKKEKLFDGPAYYGFGPSSGYSSECRVNNKIFFGYLLYNGLLCIRTPDFYKPAYKVYTEKRYIDLAKEENIPIEEHNKYYVIRVSKKQHPYFYAKIGHAYEFSSTDNTFTSDFDEIVRKFAKMHKIENENSIQTVRKIITKVVSSELPIIKNIYPLVISFEKEKYIIIPYGELKNKKKDEDIYIILKSAEWKKVFDLINSKIAKVAKKEAVTTDKNSDFAY